MQLSLPLGLTGFLFPTQSDAAYSVLRMWMAVGYTMGFVMAEFLPLNIQVRGRMSSFLLSQQLFENLETGIIA